MDEQIAHDDVADLFELDAGAEKFLGPSAFSSLMPAGRDAGQIELDVGMAAVDPVVERGKRGDPARSGSS
jgi:hypothetical protein